MVSSGEMESYRVSFLAVSDVEKMAAKSFGYCIFGLAYILLVASFAGDAVNDIRAFTTDIVFAREHLVCGAADKVARFV